MKNVWKFIDELSTVAKLILGAVVGAILVRLLALAG